MMIVKIGGGAAINLDGIVHDLTTCTPPVVVVHGANALRATLATAMGQPPRVVTSVSGVSSVLSDEHAIDMLLAAYAGIRNKRLVEACQRRGLNAIGLTGLDGRLVEGRRNGGIKVREGDKTMLVRDRSGKPHSINAALLRLLLDNGYLPILTVPIVDADGFAINADNDDVVAVLARAVACTRVVQLIEAPGLLADPTDPASVAARVSPAELVDWETRANGRFRRKIMGLRTLCADGTVEIVIADGRVANPLADALAGKGTVIRQRRPGESRDPGWGEPAHTDLKGRSTARPPWTPAFAGVTRDSCHPTSPADSPLPLSPLRKRSLT
jgi:acetylglutamate/LysW-gamma-L-alpha-aminoadipate kinase